MTTTPPAGLIEAELAAWRYEHRDELDAQIEDDEIVDVEYVQPLTTTVSFRLPVSEAAAITKAAEQAGKLAGLGVVLADTRRRRFALR